MRRGAGLVEAGDRQAVRGPSGRRPETAGLRRPEVAAVTAAVPVVAVLPLQVERALDERREDGVVDEVRREPLQHPDVRARDLVLELVPALRPVRELVRLV